MPLYKLSANVARVLKLIWIFSVVLKPFYMTQLILLIDLNLIKALNKTAPDDIVVFVSLIIFRENKTWQADGFHEMSSLIFS